MKKSIYYDISGLLSQRCILNFIIGNRGGGKTYSAKDLVTKRFLRKDEHFIWIRRYQKEIDDMFTIGDEKDFWGAYKRNERINQLYPGIEFTREGQALYINGGHCGDIVALSTSRGLKSVDFDRVTTVIFDEFIIDKGRVNYLKKEVDVLLELMETIGRLRNNVVFVLIGNAISIVNPYFRYFGITPDLNKRFTKFKDRGICIEFYFNEDFIALKEGTKLGKLIKGTDYGEYNMKNKFLRDSDAFICKRPPSANEKLWQFIFDREKFSLWRDYKHQVFYIDRTYENNFGEFRTYVTDPIDMVESDKSHIIMKKSSAISKKLLLLIERGDLYFCDQGAKQKFYEKILINY